MKPVIDKSLCIECGLCISVYPEAFFRDINYGVISGIRHRRAGFEGGLCEYLNICPEGAIKIEGVENG